MSVRLPALVLGVCVLVGTATALTYAANQTLNTAPAAVSPLRAAAPTLVVPDVQHQAYVFAKGILQDSGFAWRVEGGVRGFAANVVASQFPPAGTRVVDNGAPTVRLTLARNSKYQQSGSPQDVAPYAGTAIRPADLAGVPTTKSTAPAKTVAAAKPVTKPARKVSKAAQPKSRPADFAVAGAPREPLDELPLPERATVLGRWLAAHPSPTDANVKHWLFQHEWVVQGAKFGWWHGAEALRILVQDDRRAEAVWGIGARSGQVARATLAELEARKS